MYKAYNIETRKELRLDDNPDWEKVRSARKYIVKQLRVKPEQKIGIFYVLACHGIAEDGKQAVLVNTFNEKTGFYTFWNVELDVRGWAAQYHNSYHVVFFACCREPYSASRHRGFFVSKESALQHLENKKREKEELVKSVAEEANELEKLTKKLADIES